MSDWCPIWEADTGAKRGSLTTDETDNTDGEEGGKDA